jgi:hypothetical protein
MRAGAGALGIEKQGTSGSDSNAIAQMERLEKERADRKRKNNLMARSPKKKPAPKAPAAPAGPSKWMDKLLCMNFISLVHKYD